jgi:uncharacterized protein HemX
MTFKIQQKQKKSNPLAAVAAGVVIGAGAAVAGAAILKDKNKREKIKKVANQMKVHVDNLQKVAKDKLAESEIKAAKSENEVKKKAEEYIDATQKELDELKKNL